MSRRTATPPWLISTGCVLILIVTTTHAHIRESLLTDAIKALEKATSFLSEDYSSVNVDGLFGVRLGQGSINQSLEDCASPEYRCPHHIKESLSKLNNWIDTLAEKAMPYIEQEDPEYYAKFVGTFNAPYLMRYRIELLGSALKEPGTLNGYSEGLGDDCFARLLGTFVDKSTKKHLPKCTITDECWEYMTEDGKSRYAITHQLLYFIFAENIGCTKSLNQRLESSSTVSARDIERDMCGRIYMETLRESASGGVDKSTQDIYTEQCLLCGILGFADFYSEKTFRLLLSWQAPNGCYGYYINGLTQLTVAGDGEKKHDLLSKMQEEARRINNAGATGRKLLREKPMKGGCLAHVTGLSFGLLGGYIRFYVNLLYGPTRLTRRMTPPSWQ